MKRQRRLAGGELAPLRRLELEREAEDVAMESNCSIHVGDVFDCVGELHLLPPSPGGL
jgi:hypothetical protein